MIKPPIPRTVKSFYLVYSTFLTFKTSFGMSLIVERWRYRTPLNIIKLFLWFLITNESIITLVLVNRNKY